MTAAAIDNVSFGLLTASFASGHNYQTD